MKVDSICCVIVVYNIGEKLKECFESVYNQVNHVVLVDNGSNEETLKVLDELSKKERVDVIYNNSNKGIAYALNEGAKFAENNNFSWLLTMDNDSKATKNMVSSMLNLFNSIEENEKESIVSLFPIRIDKAIYKNNEIFSDLKGKNYKYTKLDMTSGNLVKTEIFKTVGYFNEGLFIDSVDTDFCLRLVENEYKMIVAENSYLMHSLGNITKRKIIIKNITYTNHSALRRYYITRNRKYIWNKYKNIARYEIIRDKYWNFSEIIKIIFFEEDKLNKLKMIKKGIEDYKINKFGKYSENN